MRLIPMVRWLMFGALLALAAPAGRAQAEIIMKVLIVNPSETEVKEFAIHNPLPPEVKPEHVLDADGLKVDYDAQTGSYFLVGSVTLKPKEALTKRIILEDVWVIPKTRFEGLRRETDNMQEKLTGTQYEAQGMLLASSVKRRLTELEERAAQPFLNPQQHINGYRDDLKALQMVESDLVSMRQLMVMAALNPAPETPVVLATPAGKVETGEKGELSILTTWRIIFVILGLLGGISLSFFLVWQRQLKQQLAKQREDHSTETPGDESLFTNGHGKLAPNAAPPRGAVPTRLPVPPVKP